MADPHLHDWDALPRLTDGPERPLRDALRPLFARARQIDIVAAFAQPGGVSLIAPMLLDALRRGASARLLTGDYLTLTHPRALAMLLDLAALGGALDELEHIARPGILASRLIQTTPQRSFHPKAWIFVRDEQGVAYVGSSNLSRAALVDGVEWNLRLSRREDPAGFANLQRAYESLWRTGAPLTRPLVEDYAARFARERASRAPQTLLAPTDAPATTLAPALDEPLDAPPRPHDLQIEALDALTRARRAGASRALLVMATGLGKTWTAAFDVQRELQARPDARVLVVAHRVELLRQAAETLRRALPDASLGWCVGDQDSLDAQLTLASVAKIARPKRLHAIAPDAFDYVIIDEVHHADASTYQRLMQHLTPSFWLGLTATPERGDGVNIARYFGGQPTFEVGLMDAIARGALAPLRYYGVADPLDYAPIPWRSGQLDLDALGRAAQTEERMAAIFGAMQAHPASRTLVFCASIAHADYVARWLSARGVRSVALHSGPTSASRHDALDALMRGDLDALCAVDLLNEGVDLPSVDRVVMLRPTTSSVIFQQQLGRGLRRAPGKDALIALDLVGNHHSFLHRLRHLLQLTPSGALSKTLATSPDAALAALQATAWPAGCAITLEVAAIDLLREAARAARVPAQDTQGQRPFTLRVSPEGALSLDRASQPWAPLGKLRIRTPSGAASWLHVTHDSAHLDAPRDQALTTLLAMFAGAPSAHAVLRVSPHPEDWSVTPDEDHDQRIAPPGALLDEATITRLLGVKPDGARWQRQNNTLTLWLDDPALWRDAEHVTLPDAPRDPNLTAHALLRLPDQDGWRYLGLAIPIADHDNTAWQVAPLDFATWRALNPRGGASRPLPPYAEALALRYLAQLHHSLTPGQWLEADGKRFRVVKVREGAGVTIDGGPGGFKPRNVSLTDLAWALLALDGQADSASKALIHALRYWPGTPRGSTRYIDTLWAQRIIEASPPR